MTPEMLEQYKTIIKMQREFLLKYDNFLSEYEFDDLTEFVHFPFIGNRPIYIERKCLLSERNGDYAQLLAEPGERKAGLEEIRNFTKDAENLIIVDPYIFSGGKKDAENITEDLKKSCRAKANHLKKVHIVYDSSKVTKVIKKNIEEMFKDNNIRLSVATTDSVHDRVWISDRKKGLVVGTSLNGIGNRAAFLIPLPVTDLRAILDYLDDNSLSRKQANK